MSKFWKIKESEYVNKQATCPVCLKHEFHCNGCGADLTEHIDSLVDKPIKPKEEKMEEPMITIKAAKLNFATFEADLTLDQAEKVGEEAKRIKAEIAKREEIGPGDWFMHIGRIMLCESVGYNLIRAKGNSQWAASTCRKLHPTPEQKAWLDSAIK